MRGGGTLVLNKYPGTRTLGLNGTHQRSEIRRERFIEVQIHMSANFGGKIWVFWLFGQHIKYL